MKVLITREIPEAGINILKEHKELELDYRQGPPLKPDELKEAIKGVDAIVPVIPDRITEEIIQAGLPTLKLIAHYAVGYDNIDIKAATKNRVYVSNTPGNLTESVAEHSMALMFAVGKKIVESDRFCREGNYKYWDPMIFLGPKFMGKTLGIVGFGRIGQHFAKMCKFGLNMKILYFDKNEITAEGLEDAKQVTLDELLENSDVVSLHCNLDQSTHHLIGENEVEKMKPNAILINTARGPVVNEPVLAAALIEGKIEGAGLDVFEQEPTIHKDLVKLPNVVLTPHIGSATREARIQMARMAAENVVEVLIHNRPPINLVNKELVSTLI